MLQADGSILAAFAAAAAAQQQQQLSAAAAINGFPSIATSSPSSAAAAVGNVAGGGSAASIAACAAAAAAAAKFSEKRKLIEEIALADVKKVSQFSNQHDLFRSEQYSGVSLKRPIESIRSHYKGHIRLMLKIMYLNYFVY